MFHIHLRKNNEFFSLPLFPQSSCAFENVDGETVGGVGGSVYACPPAQSATPRRSVAQCSNCGTTCASGSGLCPRCGRTMTNLT